MRISPFVPTQLLEFLSKRRYLGLSRQIGFGIPHQHTDASHPLRLLGTRGKRAHDRATNQTD